MNNKKRGSDAERLYAKIFRNLGFENCITSRYGSRYHDDLGIDLLNLPVNVQIKYGFQRGMIPSKVLQDVDERIKKSKLSKEEKIKPLILIHSKQVGKGNKRTEFDDLVILTFKDFKKLLKN
jgi:hypothetical protein